MNRPARAALGIALLALAAALPARAHDPTPAEWVSLGTHVHGGFGAYIPLGMRVGFDALKVLEAKPREVDVTVYDGPNTPCPCVADGVLIATAASPGQGTLRVAAERAAPDQLAVIVIKHRKTGRTVRYIIPDALRGTLLAWNKQHDPLGRYKAVMDAPEATLFTREVVQ